mmetsp:Transcript_40744/g.107659  ORF Transcript_40744/g.107659 Transcript_40744/m.107659 type:complete len:247 (+) Transcript_40744:412-1152(+)
MNQQDLSNTAWAYARCEVQDAPLLAAIADSALRIISAVDSRSLSIIAWAVAKLALGAEPLFQAIAKESMRLLSDAGPQGMSNTAWAFATISVLNLPLMEAISAPALPTITEFGQQELSNTAWAFAQLLVRDQPLMEEISARAIATLAEHEAAAPSPKVDDPRIASAPDLSLDEVTRGGYALVWAQGRLSLQDLALSTVASHMAHGACHGLTLGLVIADEEWSRRAPREGALAALEAMSGRAPASQG